MSATLESQQIITRLKKEGKTVYNGGLGANPLPPPQILIDTFRENVHLKQYTTPDGIPEVNESVLNHYRSGPYQPNRCLFGNGLKELLFLVQLCFEGLIIHIHPSWVIFRITFLVPFFLYFRTISCLIIFLFTCSRICF